ncbi:right-handed parallel beta-helix repeat-containing protein [Kitasatospora herbaricolor]|uniref:Right-handed parallel beta-helix repeat-containing protein n=1 Tax=Kitasatospora herbaricolor TaxID=68217 RepID=A0ABZ1WBX5_9ACTN|nr:right-handed parallel beta-helix repeat-containing protein [Kitasatospora herbaricolor]
MTAAGAAVTTLYVNNAAGSNCSDAGSGTKAAPYCHVTAAAAVVLPGQTVDIAGGTYNDTALTITRSGTAQAPITFRGPAYDVNNPGMNAAHISGGAPNHPDNGIVVLGAQHVRFQDLAVEPSGQRQAVVLDDAHDVSFTRVNAWGGGVKIGNGSTGVTYAQSQFGYTSGPLFQVDSGATGTVISTNVIQVSLAAGSSGVLANDAPSTVVVSNTIRGNCWPGIVLTGTSGGAVVENNVVDTSLDGGKACGASASDTGISVDATSTGGTKVDYNVVSPLSGGPAYSWAGTAYTTQQAFTAASGQGGHDFVATDDFQNKAQPSPVIDSADETAPGMIGGDAWNWPALDDPVVPNTGTGSGFRDRGAQEFQDFGSLFTPAGPTRLLDTRAAIGVPRAAPLSPYGTVDLQVAGNAGIPADATAVTLNVTVTDPKQDGHLTVYPYGDVLRTSSNLNWTAGTTIPNLVTVPVKDGRISLHNHSPGTAHVIADLAGYYSAKGSVFTAKSPTRLLDTRTPIGVPKAAPVGANSTLDLQVAGVGGVPADGVTAVTMNVTVTDPQQDGHLTVFPHGAQQPDASNLNWTAGTTVPNLVTVPVKDGKVSFANVSFGTTHVIADLAGYYSAEGRDTFRPVGPSRVMDTRETRYFEDGSNRPAGAVPARDTLVISFGEMPETTSVTLNVTVTEPGGPGHLTVYPHGTTAPDASNLNWTKGQTIANQVIVSVQDKKVSLYNASDAPVHVIVDLFGYQGP